MRKVGLSGYRAKRSKFGHRKARQIQRADPGVRYIIELGCLGRRWKIAALTQKSRNWLFGHVTHLAISSCDAIGSRHSLLLFIVRSVLLTMTTTLEP